MRKATSNQVSQDRLKLENPYAHLNGDGKFEALVNNAIDTSSQQLSAKSTLDPAPFQIQISKILKKQRRCEGYQKRDVESAAQNLQREMWRQRHFLHSDSAISDPLEILDPSLALRCLGFSFQIRESLGQYADRSGTFEVAGIIDPPSREVYISRQFPRYVRNFTTAHELGHAVLHREVRLHRDRALDGSGTTVNRDYKEVEADTFAAAFLLPAKQVRLAFKRTFLAPQFVLTDATAFALGWQTQDALRERLRAPRDLARLLARAKFYNSLHFVSLAQQFNVSVEAMAIRIEDLDLIQL